MRDFSGKIDRDRELYSVVKVYLTENCSVAAAIGPFFVRVTLLLINSR